MTTKLAKAVLTILMVTALSFSLASAQAGYGGDALTLALASYIPAYAAPYITGPFGSLH